MNEMNELIKFDMFNLCDALSRALVDLKFLQPTTVQIATIPKLLAGQDIIAQAQTGTGKTAAFAVPILQRLVLPSTTTQALILAPTRELAIQIGEQFTALSKYLRGFKIAVLCGGQDYRNQLKQLRDGAQIVVGTPGRILDHIDRSANNRSTLKLDRLTTFVLDEADEMLRMGFIEDVERILKELPSNKQMTLFSATMPTRIRQIANQYLNKPESISIHTETATVKNISQYFSVIQIHQKLAALLRILIAEEHQGVIVFVRTKISSEEVAKFLQDHGCKATAIHGDLSQPLREKIIGQFKNGSIDILVATDVAARGLDVDRGTHVINYDAPHDSETYVHRIGRTGRAGRSGMSILFVAPRDMRLISTIERHTRETILKLILPNDQAIASALEKRFCKTVSERLQHQHLHTYHNIIARLIDENPALSAIDIAAALALINNQDKPWKVELPPVSVFEDRRGQRLDNEKESVFKSNFRENNNSKRSNIAPRNRHQNNNMQTCYRIEVGRVHGVKPGNIVGAIANEGGISSRFITDLQIHAEHSTVRLPNNIPRETLNGLQRARVCGRQLKLASLSAA